MLAVEFAFRLDLPEKTSICKPDLVVVMHDNLTVLYDKDDSYKSVFYLCVERISDLSKRDIEWDTIDKKKEYEER